MIRLRTLGTIDLRDAQDRELDSILAQPKRLALFIYLLLATPRGFHRRDRLTLLFWPDAPTTRARAALSRAIYQLRNVLGPDVIQSRGDEEVGVDFEAVRCDALMLEDLYAAHEWRQVADLFAGELLSGFHVSDASPDFDQWLEQRRGAFQHKAADAAWKVAEAARSAGEDDRAAQYARKAVALRPDDERQLRQALLLLDAVGDRTGASDLYEQFVARLAREYELEPADETRQAIQAIRAKLPGTIGEPARFTPVALAAEEPRIETGGGRRRWIPAAAVLAVVILLLGLRLVSSKPPSAIIAVGEMQVSADSFAGFRSLLTTNLARIQGVEVLSESRIAELSAHQSMEAAARAAGASELVAGTLAVRPDGTLRLDLRRVDAATGNLRSAYSIQARDRYELLDAAVDRIARDMHARAPEEMVEGRTTSLAAYRFYEEGLKAHFRADPATAEKFMRAAVAEDSTLAMAWFFLATTAGDDDYLQRARRFARLSSDRERLLIEAEWARRQWDPRLVAIADTLVTRYPRDPDAHLLYGRALMVAGQSSAAIEHLLHVIHLDSANIGTTADCRACEAFASVAGVYAGMDSLAAAERVVRRWRSLMPASYNAWRYYSSVLYTSGRLAEAEAALDTAARFTSDVRGLQIAYTTVWHRRGNYEAIDRLWQEFLRTGDDDLKTTALWGQIISFRAQGRLREALASAREYSRLRNKVVPVQDRIGQRLLEALVLFEMQKYDEAGTILQQIATRMPGAKTPAEGAHRAWHFAHLASVYAAASDTAQLRSMEDSVRVNGALTNQAAMQRLHYYVRGLRLQAQHRDAEAADAFRNAIINQHYSMARISLQLARSLIRSGKPNEAIPVLRAAFLGPVSAVGLYASQSDLQETLGLAYERSNRPDSAIAQYRAVLRAWKNADPEFAARKQALEKRVAALQQTRSMER